MVLLSAQGMPVGADGLDSPYPRYKGGRPKTFPLPERREIKKMARSAPVEHGLPFSTWS